MELGDSSSDSQVNASFNMLHKQMNDLVDTLNNSIEEIKVKEQLKMMNASFAIDVLHQQINDLAGTLNTSIQQILERENEKEQITITSCAAVLLFNSSSPSGYYWIRSSNSSSVHVYCDMTLSCGNVTGGWMRVANLDMRDSNTQ